MCFSSLQDDMAFCSFLFSFPFFFTFSFSSSYWTHDLNLHMVMEAKKTFLPLSKLLYPSFPLLHVFFLSSPSSFRLGLCLLIFFLFNHPSTLLDYLSYFPSAVSAPLHLCRLLCQIPLYTHGFIYFFCCYCCYYLRIYERITDLIHTRIHRSLRLSNDFWSLN